MSTNGVVAFQVNGKLKSIYNHWDSYPNKLGNETLDFIRRYSTERIKEAVNNMVNTRDIFATFLDFETYIDYEDKKMFHYEDSTSFMERSLYCEWAYIINLDTNELEIYKGSNKDKPIGRFRDIESIDGYYPVSLIRIYNLSNLPSKLILETLDVKYKEFNIELDTKVLNKLKKLAKEKKMSVESLIVEIIRKEVNKED